VVTYFNPYDYIREKCTNSTNWMDEPGHSGPFPNDRTKFEGVGPLGMGQGKSVGGGRTALVVRYVDSNGIGIRSLSMDLVVTIRSGERERELRLDRAWQAFCDLPESVMTIRVASRPLGVFANGPPMAGTAQAKIDGTARLDTLTVILRPIAPPAPGGKR
jgi:hypothetical protein